MLTPCASWEGVWLSATSAVPSDLMATPVPGREALQSPYLVPRALLLTARWWLSGPVRLLETRALECPSSLSPGVSLDSSQAGPLGDWRQQVKVRS